MKIVILHLVIACALLFGRFDPPEMRQISQRLSRLRPWKSKQRLAA